MVIAIPQVINKREPGFEVYDDSRMAHGMAEYVVSLFIP